MKMYMRTLDAIMQGSKYGNAIRMWATCMYESGVHIYENAYMKPYMRMLHRIISGHFIDMILLKNAS